MKLDEFTEALNEALVLRGVPEHIASLNVEKLSAHLNSDAFRAMEAYSSKEELNQMADDLSGKLLRHLQIKDDNLPADTDKTDAEQKLKTLNDAVNRAVENVSTDKKECDVTDGEKDDIEFTASTEIIFDEDDDVIELCASPSIKPATFTKNVAVSPDVPEGAGSEELNFNHLPKSLSDEAPGAPSTEDDFAEENTVSFVLPVDDIGEYAPDAEMLTSMGLADVTYEAEAIETRAQKGVEAHSLPPLPTIYESAEGKKKFRNALICLSPFIAVAASVYFAAWGFAFATEVALIAALIASLVAVAAAGTLATITGIIYGIVRLSDRRGEGVFEIGLGIVIAGATLLAGILIYNAALRFMPWAIKKTAYLFRLCSRCVRIRIRQARGRFSEK